LAIQIAMYFQHDIICDATSQWHFP
jgi:hypothetical protein